MRRGGQNRLDVSLLWKVNLSVVLLEVNSAPIHHGKLTVRFGTTFNRARIIYERERETEREKAREGSIVSSARIYIYGVK